MNRDMQRFPLRHLHSLTGIFPIGVFLLKPCGAASERGVGASDEACLSRAGHTVSTGAYRVSVAGIGLASRGNDCAGCDQTAMRNSIAEKGTLGVVMRRPACVFLSETRP